MSAAGGDKAREREKKRKPSLQGYAEAIKNAKAGVSALDAMVEEDQEDVYDVVDEDEYARIVDRRRKENDFVVDDDGIGYHDDGEEVLGVSDEPDGKKRLKNLAEDNDKKIGSKVRRLSGGSQTNDMMKFVKAGANSAKMAPQALKEVDESQLLDIDALMGGGGGGGGKGGRPPLHSVQAASSAPVPAYMKRPVQGLAPSRMAMSGNNMSYSASLLQDVGDYADDFSGGYMGEDTVTAQGGDGMQVDDVASAGAVQAEPEKVSLMKATRKLQQDDEFTDPGEAFKPVLADADYAAASSLGLGNIGSGASTSHETIDPKLWLQKAPPTTDAEGKEVAGEDFLNLFWIDIHEAQGIIYLFGKVALTEPAPAPATGAPAAAAAAAAAATTTRFVSCCVAVHGVERNLFVLPKATGMGFHQDGKPQRADMMKVYSDIKDRLVGPIIPRNATGQAFKVKQVKRRYAFEHTDVPREETDYLKVVYSAKYPAPTLQQCAPSDVVERIFGAANSGVSLVEAFLMKRKIFGPCWLTVRNPRSIDTKASYCKLEVGIESPKFVSNSPQKTPPMPSPPLVSLSIALKTAVNPITHVHEVIAISGLVHTKIEIDTDTDPRPQLMKRFTYIRQLGVSCGMQYPSSFPHDLPKHIEAVDRQAGGKVVEAFTNERALLNRFFIRIQQEDPDILASHNLFGFEFDVLLSRAVANKIPVWDRLGRLKKSRVPKSINDKDSVSGRILCCTYLAAKEFLRETNYSLMSLAESQLHTKRIEVDPMDVPRFFATSLDILKIANHTSMDAMLVQRLMLKLQIVPLTKALTNISGNVWSRTMRGQRAERIEYLLLHRFHFHKFILPERKPYEAKVGKGRQGFAAEEEEQDPEEGGGRGKVGGKSHKRAKAAYAGGLVLEPKKGLYDHFILLLDFNSLYPSIIQEYNLCFTTVNWTKFMMEGQASSSAGLKAIADKAAAKAAAKKSRKSDATVVDEGDDDDDDDDVEGGVADGAASMADTLPPLPDSAISTGILPTVIKALVDARRAVKSTMKTERNKDKLANLEIRQKAYKLTANSMYGCLGFTFSRFYARPIAALVTAKGREALTRTVDQASRVMQLDVIYGDTDSVMINTNSTDYKAVMELGMQVKTAVNKLYKSLELDIDGVFKSMLLLKKKKYAALVIKEEKGGELICEKELKGLDLVRRDWCPLSKDTGKFVVDQILSGKPREDIVIAIHDYLQELSTKIRSGTVDLKEFVVTKGLNKAPKDYPDCKGQAHLQVALQMMKMNRPVNIGDHIPYVICTQGEEGAAAAQRARHPDEVFRSNGELTLDFEWYLSNQLLPPISRLCEPIEGTSTALMSAKLGLDASKYAKASSAADDRDEDYGYVPRCKMSDEERFKSCRRLMCKCSSCGVEQEFRGTFTERGNSGLDCSQCGAMYFGRTGPANCYSYLSNRVTLLVRECVKKYYDCWLSCDDQSCRKHTMQQSVMGKRCTEDCHGHMVQDYTDLDLHTQLKYLETLFDFQRAVDLRAALIVAPELLQQPLLAEELKKKEADKIVSLTPHDYVALMELLYKHMCNSIEWSGYNWVRPSLWSAVFGKILHKTVI